MALQKVLWATYPWAKWYSGIAYKVEYELITAPDQHVPTGPLVEKFEEECLNNDALPLAIEKWIDYDYEYDGKRAWRQLFYFWATEKVSPQFGGVKLGIGTIVAIVIAVIAAILAITTIVIYAKYGPKGVEDFWKGIFLIPAKSIAEGLLWIAGGLFAIGLVGYFIVSKVIPPAYRGVRA